MRKDVLLSICLIGLVLPHGTVSQVSEQDSLALVAVYNSTNGNGWLDNSGWLNGPVTDWYGVDLEGNRVSRLLLEDNNLVGTLPEEIGDLTEVEFLNVSVNKISGSIPTSIGNCTKLYYLDVKGNEFTGPIPVELSNCTALRTIWAINNMFSGPFPEALLLIDSIEVIRIGGNDFEGEVPASVADLANLIVLEIASNGFSGMMPSVSDLSKLIVLEVWGNALEGDIGEILGYHPDLIRFRCRSNHFTGCVSEMHFSPSALGRLELYNNDFDCVGDFSAFIDTGVLTQLWCSNNKIPFEYLEPNVGVESYTYDPQDSMLSPESHVLSEGANLIIDSGTKGSNTSYTWFKDDQVIPDEIGSTFEINGFSESDVGTYHMSATNTLLPDLTLYRHKVHVQSDEVSAIQFQHAENLRIYPNPVSDQLFIHGMTGEGRMKIFDINGRVVFNEWRSMHAAIPLGNLTAGLYILKVHKKGTLYTSRFVKF